MRRPLIPVAVAAALVLSGLAYVAPAQASGKYYLTAKLADNYLPTSQQVKITGHVGPSASGQKVYLQRYLGGKWQTALTRTLNRSSNYTFAFYKRTGGVYKYRVYKARYNARAGGYSPSMTLRVYRWRPLTTAWIVDEGSTSGKFIGDNGARSTNGILLLRTLEITAYGYPGAVTYAEFNLSRKCDVMKAVIGLDDEFTRADASAQVTVLADGVPKFDRAFAVGQSAAVNLNVASSLRLRLQTTHLTGDVTDDPDVLFGNASVRCLS